MANVTDEDREFSRRACGMYGEKLAILSAEARERIEARKDAVIAERDKRISELESCSNAIEAKRVEAHELAVALGKRIAELEARLPEVTRAAEDAGWNGVENPKSLAGFIGHQAERISELESQLRYERIDCDEWRAWARMLTGFAEGSTDGGLRSGVERKFEAQLDAKHAKLVEVADKLAAAKPVLTMCDLHRKHVEECRATVERFTKDGEPMPSLVALFADLVHVVDTLCPPPKEPPTLDELASKIALVMGAMAPGSDGQRTLEFVHGALRARGEK